MLIWEFIIIYPKQIITNNIKKISGSNAKM